MSKWAWKPNDYAEMVMSEMQHTRCMSGMHMDDAIYTYGMTGCKLKTTKVMHFCTMHELRCMLKCDVIHIQTIYKDAHVLMNA